jgi:hypothetical protein
VVIARDVLIVLDSDLCKRLQGWLVIWCEAGDFVRDTKLFRKLKKGTEYGVRSSVMDVFFFYFTLLQYDCYFRVEVKNTWLSESALWEAEMRLPQGWPVALGSLCHRDCRYDEVKGRWRQI